MKQPNPSSENNIRIAQVVEHTKQDFFCHCDLVNDSFSISQSFHFHITANKGILLAEERIIVAEQSCLVEQIRECFSKR